MLAVLYLVIFGSLVGYSVYIWLLRVASASAVSTYAYVNPVVAVFLGWLILSEPLTPRTLAAAAVIVGAVALITRGAAPSHVSLPAPSLHASSTAIRS
jgi:drug/metabolite transporter (DMT)-like permease